MRSFGIEQEIVASVERVVTAIVHLNGQLQQVVGTGDRIRLGQHATAVAEDGDIVG